MIFPILLPSHIPLISCILIFPKGWAKDLHKIYFYLFIEELKSSYKYSQKHLQKVTTTKSKEAILKMLMDVRTNETLDELFVNVKIHKSNKGHRAYPILTDLKFIFKYF